MTAWVEQVDREQPRELGEPAEVLDDGRDRGGQDRGVDRDQPDAQHHGQQDGPTLAAQADVGAADRRRGGHAVSQPVIGAVHSVGVGTRCLHGGVANVIEASGLKKQYGDVMALDGLDLEVEEGTVMGLLGPNGAGKTTTVRVLTTLLKADSGNARVLGLDVARRARSCGGGSASRVSTPPSTST